MTTDDATLFDGSNPDDKPATEPQVTADAGPIIFVTNRYNLLEFMSAGMILPSPAIPKYYSDLLELSPGRIPLLRGPVHDSITELVQAEDDTAFPVALEIDPSRLEASECSALDDTGSASLLEGETPAWAPGGVIPVDAVPRLHFRSQADLEEHEAREYGNIRANIPAVVSPNLFEGGALTAEQLTVFLRSLESLDDGLKELLEQADRTAGARVLTIDAVPAEPECVRELVKLIAGGANKSKPKELPPEISAAIGGRSKVSGSGTDAELFKVAADACRGVDRAAKWRPVELLNQIHEQFRETDPSSEALATVEQNLRPIEGILRNERDFKPFHPGRA